MDHPPLCSHEYLTISIYITLGIIDAGEFCYMGQVVVIIISITSLKVYVWNVISTAQAIGNGRHVMYSQWSSSMRQKLHKTRFLDQIGGSDEARGWRRCA